MAGPDLDLSDLTSQAVDNLVTQFASHLDFYRELVQNSIDAGSAAIDVWMEYIAGEGDQGTIAIHVDDSGDGMTEAIIDDQLTKLFASAKEGDLTKIGKFGIGFVSVFACRPKAVLVHTGRDGESWEVCFDADRSFVKARLDAPVDGTQITLFLEGDRGRYGELVEASRRTLDRWCSHSDVDVTFEDRSAPEGGAAEAINRRFAVEGEPMVRVEVEGAEIVAAHGERPVYGFYNKGLALAVSSDAATILGDRAGRFEHVAFKIKSRYLEHTLSRDTVVRDANYEKAMAMVEAAVAGPLQDALVSGLAALAKAPAWGIAEAERYFRWIGALAREPIAEVMRHQGVPFLRTLAGRPLALAEVERAAVYGERLFISDAPSILSEHLAAEGVAVLFGRRPAGDGVEGFGEVGRLVVAYLAFVRRASLGGRARGALGYDHWAACSKMLAAPERELFAVEVGGAGEPAVDGLIADAARLLASAGVRYRRVVGARLALGDPAAPLAVFAPTVGRFMARRSLDARGVGLGPVEVAVNRGHAQVLALARLRGRAPALAAYCLAKDLLRAEERAAGLDLELMAAALPAVRGAYGEAGR